MDRESKSQKKERKSKEKTNEDEIFQIKNRLEDLLKKYPEIYKQKGFMMPWGPVDAGLDRYKELLHIALAYKDLTEQT